MAPPSLSSPTSKAPSTHFSIYTELVSFKIEGILFTVPREPFDSLSPGFVSRYADPAKGVTGSEEQPIVLGGVKAAEFQLIISLLFSSNGWIQGDPPPIKDIRDWITILKLSTNWGMTKTFRPTLPTKIQLARQYHVPTWFLEGAKTLAESPDLCGFPLEKLASYIGWETIARITSLGISYKAAPVSALPASGELSIPIDKLHCKNPKCAHPFSRGTCSMDHSRLLPTPPTSMFGGATSPPAKFGSPSFGTPGGVMQFKPNPFANLDAREPTPSVTLEWSFVHSHVQKQSTSIPVADVEAAFAAELKTLRRA
ncbi:hypothetical protein CC1G_14304 [Coprinopsis cinerea okayama7|uniref:BTB domain-containing protein n=1 Tax=Coprinopsis cinerea (strain Okayama-7 / 130 / ATCC MYA-4618 / FGSC 9003) TaxID=240176 RepID=D6RLT0_COPC7|nr:hypothetical protein CC1G_14304 [Coprinopsis cinerea okayama7\|eukprot:XP_002911773.1 hypothetical protein CC1G_14304 [Coprinopsis cinerea okayama7\